VVAAAVSIYLKFQRRLRGCGIVTGNIADLVNCLQENSPGKEKYSHPRAFNFN
jgi:hypothetical protein